MTATQIQNKQSLNFSAPQMSVLTSTADRTLFFSGQGGGKTFLEGVISYLLVQSCPKSVGMICANTYGQLSASTLKEIKKVWADVFNVTEYTKSNPTGTFVSNRYPPVEWGWEGKYHERLDDSYGTICFKNGALIYKASLDNYKAIDGRTLAWCILDETKDTKEEAVKMVILGRLRQKGLYLKNNHNQNLKEYFNGGKLGSMADLIPFTDQEQTAGKANKPINPLWMFTTPYKELWLLKFFELHGKIDKIKQVVFSETDYYVSQEGNKKVVIASNYHNSQNLPANFISNLREDLTDELIDLKVYAYPFAKSGKEYAKHFDRKSQVGSVGLLGDAMLHFTVDFNVNPYMSGLIIQLEHIHNSPGKKWNGFSTYIICRVLGEYALKYPKNEAYSLGSELVTEFEDMLHYGFYLYGDASGNNRIGISNTKSLFVDLMRGLGDFRHRAQLRIPRSNPRYKHVNKDTLGRKNFLNLLLSGKKPVRIIIDKGCTEFIDDLEFCEEDANGKLAKPKTKGVELRGHHLQAFEYFICHEKMFAPLAIVRTK